MNGIDAKQRLLGGLKGLTLTRAARQWEIDLAKSVLTDFLLEQEAPVLPLGGARYSAGTNVCAFRLCPIGTYDEADEYVAALQVLLDGVLGLELVEIEELRALMAACGEMRYVDIDGVVFETKDLASRLRI